MALPFSFVDANGRVGSSLSEAVGPAHPETETMNVYLFHQWMLQARSIHFDEGAPAPLGGLRLAPCVTLTLCVALLTWWITQAILGLHGISMLPRLVMTTFW